MWYEKSALQLVLNVASQGIREHDKAKLLAKKGVNIGPNPIYVIICQQLVGR